MKYVLIAALLTACCNEKENKISDKSFVYGQEVQVISGFYIGYIGTVEGEGSSYSDCRRTYGVYLKNGPGYRFLCNDKLEAYNATQEPEHE